jgi:hypothetical protein
MSDIHDDASTISDQASNNPHLSGARSLTVPVITLDCLIAHYGVPDYIKLDVEGYEANVLDGLSTQPSLLSFEFHHLYADRASVCLDKPVFCEGSLFNVSDESGTGFERSKWVSRDEMKTIVKGIAAQKTYRDIYVRKPVAK